MRVRKTAVLILLAIAAPGFAQVKFDSAEAAADAVIAAAASHDNARLTAIFGPDGGAILTSGKPAQDRAEQEEFSKLAAAKHRLEVNGMNPGRVVLSIGDEDWPFPVPLVRGSDGKWRFDAQAARVEMQARRIGTHEMDVVEICAGYVDAQRKFASEAHDRDGMLEYAAHPVNSGDRHNGLYQDGAALVPREFAAAILDGAGKGAKPYHGYFFRILYGQGSHARGGAHNFMVKNRLLGGFGLVAWPAEYGVTGIHTFMVNQDGVVYQKDIAPAPGAAPVTRFDPDPSWSLVDQTEAAGK